jgi:hypothetical protein
MANARGIRPCLQAVYKKRIPSHSSPAVGFTISMVIGIKTVLWQKGVIRSVKLNQSCSLDKLHGIDTENRTWLCSQYQRRG